MQQNSIQNLFRFALFQFQCNFTWYSQHTNTSRADKQNSLNMNLRRRTTIKRNSFEFQICAVLCCCFSSLFGINLFRVNFICIHRPQKSQNSAQPNTQCPNECAQNIECEQNGHILSSIFATFVRTHCVRSECCAKTEKGHALTRSPIVIHILQVACGL